MTLLAKSKPAQTLYEHTVEVIDQAQALLNGMPLSNEDRAGLAELLWIAAAAHDIGKAASGFQAMLRNEAVDWKHRRHETLSTAFACRLPGVTVETLFAILTHHRQIPWDFQDKGELVLHEFLPLGWNEMVGEIQQNAESALSVWNEVCLAYNRPNLALSRFPELARTLGIAEEWLVRLLQLH